jgi:hypothetical protein
MGAWIAPLAVAWEPLLRAVVLSGAGGSWIDNVMYKQQPINIKKDAELIIGYLTDGYSLTPFDPLLSLIQWAAEAADPQLYARYLVAEPLAGAEARSLLMVQGIVDHYILPDIANSLSLSLGLDLGGPELDGGNAELMADGQTPLGTLLPLTGRQTVTLPATGNRDGVTALVVQWPGDGIEDGHEVLFQTEPPKRQYRCFLETFAAGTARVPTGDAECP